MAVCLPVKVLNKLASAGSAFTKEDEQLCSGTADRAPLRAAPASVPSRTRRAAFGDIVAVALHNLMLLDNIQRAERRRDAVVKIMQVSLALVFRWQARLTLANSARPGQATQASGSSATVTVMLQRVLDAIHPLIGAEQLSLWLLDPDTDRFFLCLTRNDVSWERWARPPLGRVLRRLVNRCVGEHRVPVVASQLEGDVAINGNLVNLRVRGRRPAVLIVARSSLTPALRRTCPSPATRCASSTARRRSRRTRSSLRSARLCATRSERCGRLRTPPARALTVKRCVRWAQRPVAVLCAVGKSWYCALAQCAARARHV
jgi:hypothetical protein